MTIWTPDLAVQRGPRYLAIADALERDVAEGALQPGDRMPPQRDLAWALGVTVGTIGRAYAEAGRRGLISGEVGRGTYVNAPAAQPGARHASHGMPDIGDRVPGPFAAAHIDQANNWFARHGEAVEAIDLGPNYPDSDGMAAMMAKALAMVQDRGHLDGLVNYAYADGRPEHRAAACRWLKTRGIDATASSVLITPGCQGALNAVLPAVSRPGDAVLCEALSWPGMVSYAWLHGLHAHGVAMDQDGIIPEAFEEACKRYRPTAAYLMPTVHNPTTTILSESRRQQLADIARRYKLYLIEDDVYGFLAPDSPPPIRSFAPDIAIYISSLSKAVAPGLRVGFAVGPESLIPIISAALRTTVLMSAPLLSELAMHLIDSGLAEQAAERQRATAIRRQRIAATVLGNRYDPSNTCGGRAFHIWLPLPEPWRIHDFVAALRNRGVALTPGDAFKVDPPGRNDTRKSAVPMNAVRVCLNGPENDDDVRHGLTIIGDLLRQPTREAMPVI